MSIRSIGSGTLLAARRPGLTALIYLANLVLALVVSIPLFSALSAATASTGYAPEMVRRFDLVLWADILEQASDVIVGSLSQLFWIVPVYVLWKTAFGVGLVHALRDGGVRSFWQGVGHYTGRAILMAILFGLTVVVWLVAAGAVLFIAGLIFTTAESQFLLYWVVGPSVLILGIAVLDLMHDYGRMSLVIANRGAVASWMEGLQFPLRHPTTFVVYFFWAALAVLLSLVAVHRLTPSWGESMGGVWLLFLTHQAVLLVRAAITVAWFGSEVRLFERIRLRQAPLIAEDAVPGQAAPGVQLG